MHSNHQQLARAKQHGYHTIGRAAELSGVSAKMIRHYESLGLIAKPSRTQSGYRVYSEADVHSLRFIHRARSLGFTTQEIADLLGLWRNQRRKSAQVKRLVNTHLQALERKIAELETMRATLQQLSTHCQGDERPDCPILDDLSTGTHSCKAKL